MPVIIRVSGKHLSADQGLSMCARAALATTVKAAREWLLGAIAVVGHNKPMSPDQMLIWHDCFLAQPSNDVRRTAHGVLLRTFRGLSRPHTIKLDDVGNGQNKCRDLGGTRRPINLPLCHFDPSIPRPAGMLVAYGVDRRIWSYVHEATHLFADTEDIGAGGFRDHSDAASNMAYLSQDHALDRGIIRYWKQPGLLPHDALKNADSFSAFVVMLERFRKGLYKPAGARVAIAS